LKNIRTGIFENALQDLLPSSMIPVVVRRSGIPKDEKVNAVTKEQRRELLTLLKNFPVEIACKAPVEEAIVTSGGVSTARSIPKTMESKKVKGLYFAGEILDVDAYTGGFNLQIAWATGYAAGLRGCKTGQRRKKQMDKNHCRRHRRPVRRGQEHHGESRAQKRLDTAMWTRARSTAPSAITCASAGSAQGMRTA
jgi:hypothetical protein